MRPGRVRGRRPGAYCTLAAACAIALAASGAAAQTYEQTRAVIAAGGGSSADSTGALRISGTIAEALTGGARALSSSGVRTVATGGFWADARAPRDGTFRDHFEDPPAATSAVATTEERR